MTPSGKASTTGSVNTAVGYGEGLNGDGVGADMTPSGKASTTGSITGGVGKLEEAGHSLGAAEGVLVGW